MINKEAIWSLALGVLLFGLAAISAYRASSRESVVVFALLLTLGIVALCYFVSELRNYPTKYVPSGWYSVLFAKGSDRGVLVALLYLGRPNALGSDLDTNELKEISGNEKSPWRTRLFFVPTQWFRVDEDLSARDQFYLVCKRVSGHPVILVSRDFYETHCRPAKSARATQAA